MRLQDDTLKRTQVLIAILAGLVTFIVGAYNAKNIFFHKKETPPAVQAPQSPNPVQSAIQEVSAAWIKKWGQPKKQ